MIVRFQYAKMAQAKYIAHLDLTRLLRRALRRAEIRVAHSEGFNPHPKIAFGPPLPVGVEGEREYVDIALEEPLQDRELECAVERLRAQLPTGLTLTDYVVLPPGTPKLMAVLDTARYDVHVSIEASWEVSELQAAVERWLGRTESVIERNKGTQRTSLNIRPFVRTIEIVGVTNSAGMEQRPSPVSPAGVSEIHFIVETVLGNSGSVRALELLEALSRDEELPLIWRRATVRRRSVSCRGQGEPMKF